MAMMTIVEYVGGRPGLPSAYAGRYTKLFDSTCILFLGYVHSGDFVSLLCYELIILAYFSVEYYRNFSLISGAS